MLDVGAAPWKSILEARRCGAAAGGAMWIYKRLAVQRAAGSRFAVADAPHRWAHTQRRQLCLLACVQAAGAMILGTRGRCLH